MGSFLADLLLGYASAAAAKTLTAPAERTRLLLATPSVRSSKSSGIMSSIDCAVRIYKEQGLRRFWTGNLTNCLRYCPGQACCLAFKDACKRAMPRFDPTGEFPRFLGANLLSGGLAGAGCLCVVHPLDYARTQFFKSIRSGQNTFTGVGDCIYRTATGPGGFLALYTGFGRSASVVVLYRALQLGGFDTITGLSPWREDKGARGAMATFAAAQAATVVGAGASYPFDTVRRRLQMQSDMPVEKHAYKGTVDCFRRIVTEEGVKPLLGLPRSFLRINICSALVLTFYDRAKTHLNC